MTRVHASDGSLLAEYARERRLYIPIQAVPKLVINAFIAAEDKNFYEHGGHRLLRHRARRGAVTCRTTAAGGARRAPRPSPSRSPRTSCSPTRCRSTRKIKEALLAMKIERDLLQGEDPRALSQRDLSRHRRLRRRRRVAALFRQVGARADARGSGLSRGAAQGAEQLPSVPPARARDRAAQLRARSHGRGRLHHRAGGGEGEEGAAQGHAAADRRPHLRRRIFRRGSAPLRLRELRREEALRGRPLGAHHARPQDAGAGAQGAGRRPREFRRAAGLSRARQQARHGGRLGRQARRRQGAVATSRRGGSRWCWRSTTAPPASACSPGATRAARSPRSARPACFRSKA